MEQSGNPFPHPGHFKMGPNTLSVPMSLHKNLRERLVERFRAGEEKTPPNGVILLQGGSQETRYDTDHEPLFRQESNFHYLFGVTEAEFFGAIEVDTGRAHLFMPRLPAEYAIWMGKINPPPFFKEKYGVEEMHFVDEIDDVLTALNTSIIYVLHGLNTDSGNYAKPATFNGIEKYRVDNGRLHPVLTECRVFKTSGELEVLRYANKISSEAHIKVMQQCKVGFMEYQLESIFLHDTYFHGGSRYSSYACICASGESAATLHYGHAGVPNSKRIKDGDMMLLDMGAEYHCYASDITCSFPANGRFTPDQKAIYETVLNAMNASMNAMRPGVSWPDVHRISLKYVCKGLKAAGILRGKVSEMMKHHIGPVFMPHGLGHFMGKDTHDCGGYPKGVSRVNEPGTNKLRTARVLEEGMVITVEPGVYFIDIKLESALRDENQKQFINEERLKDFRGWGGVRLEDDVIITATGIENMTQCPRTVEEVEACMAGLPWRATDKK